MNTAQKTQAENKAAAPPLPGNVSAPAGKRPYASALGPIKSGGTIIGFALLVAAFGLMRPDVFLTFGNLRNVLEQVAILAIIAAVQTVVMVVGNFDLSVGATASVSGAVVAQLLIAGQGTAVAVAGALVVGALVGAVNGYLTAYLKLSAFVATLATMTSVSGLAFITTDGTTLFGLPQGFMSLGQGRWLGLPIPIFMAAAVALVVWFVLRNTTIGRRWHAVGGNAEVAKLSGVNVNRVRFLAFVVAGVGAALAGVVLTSRLASATATSGDSYMLLAIAAVFLGMTISKEGTANIGGTLIGVGILGVLSNGLNIIGVSTYVQQFLTGIIIIAAVAFSRLGNKGVS
ncbi:ribose transport system permease protein rbsC [Arthrobacter crystallopoietes BAB-32]|uniref:Ribose transport system permease protein rbsC n=1 Tax=Arthrobacter crystallopoietes BAB-32 TaxID=1246476 RepID=N1UZI0_9MICC|nr:ABC transporter permease [Arthrobacter crystallopoietes]EMY34475.1 ribose transport system permease protein rbsC [Arthrobacter crystallopoietes BAB-32]